MRIGSACYPAEMSDRISLVKARYCLSIMKIASTSSADVARQLVDGLSTEFLTPDISQDVKIAERNALAAVLTLSEKFQGRSAVTVAGEWNAAFSAIQKWIAVANDALPQASCAPRT